MATNKTFLNSINHNKWISIICFFLNFGGNAIAQSEKAETLHSLEFQEKLLAFNRHISDADLLINYHPNSALVNIKLALDIANQVNSISLKAAVYNRFGLIYASFGDLEKAMDYIVISNKLANEVQDQLLAAKNKVALGNIFRIAGESRVAIEFYNEALSTYLNMLQYEQIIDVYSNLGKSFKELGEADSALYFVSQGLMLSGEYSQILYPSLNFQQSELLLSTGRITDAESILTNVYELAHSAGDIQTIAKLNQVNAEIELKKGNILLAYELTQNSIQIAKEIGNKELIHQAYNTMSKCLDLRNRPDSALYYQRLSYIFKDSVQNLAIRNRLSLFNYQKSQNELLLLKERNRLSELNIKSQQYTIISMFVIIILFLGLVVSVYWGRIKERNARERIEKSRQVLEEQKTQLEHMNKFKIELFGMVAHDLRSPLQSVYTILQLIKEGLYSESGIKNLLPEIEKRLNVVSGLMTNLLDWAKLTMQDKENVLRIATIEMHEFLSDVASSMMQFTTQKQLNIDVDADKNLYINIDQQLISTVLRNLIANAIKYSHPNSTITIAGKLVNGEYLFSVSDQGVGMDYNIASKLFTTGLKSHKGTAGELGSGFGLRLCKDFVDLHEGHIWAESLIGEGTTFFFSIPDFKIKIANT